MEIIEKDLTQMVIFALLAFLALIAAVVLAIILIVKKEKRRQMKKTKIAAVVSALLVPVMSFISVVNWYASTLVIIEPVGWMPDLVGLDYDECKFAYDGLFELIYEEEYSYEYPKGVIIWQDTAPHSIIYSPGKEVHCAVSKGVRTIDVADVIGLDSDEAKKTLEENCFTVILALKYSDDISKGNVIATDPPAGEKAAYGSAVKVTVSGGKEPDVTDNGTAP